MRLMDICGRALVIAISIELGLFGIVRAQSTKRATVHLRYVDFRGEEIAGDGIVDSFLADGESSTNLAAGFSSNTAHNIPYGTYRLKTHRQGFYTAYRNVLVYQDDVWVVVQLTVGVEDGPIRRVLTGEIKGGPSSKSSLWVRAQGLYSDVIADAKVSAEGAFQLGGLTDGIYIISIRQGDQVLDTRAVKLPSDAETDAVFAVHINLEKPPK